MKKFLILFPVLLLALNIHSIAAQNEDDNRPYLTDDDIEAIEMVLPFDSPESIKAVTQNIVDIDEFKEEPPAPAPAPKAKETPKPAAAAQTLYHLLILDRVRSPLNSDIGKSNNITVVYKFKHGKNGYLIAIYKAPDNGPGLPVLPARSRILVNFSTAQKSMLKDYVNSSAFKRLVTHRTVTAQLKKLFTQKW
ncbi:MAG: hypothetical protein FWF29_00050 [Treponema sp.]|nr:hypothetical protein [Treponema sp.]